MSRRRFGNDGAMTYADLAAKTVLITGGATGIGRATAIAFGQAGANVVIADTSQEAAYETVHSVQDAGARAIFVRTDVSRAADCEAMVKATLAEFGALDCAFNNAGTLHAPQPVHEFDEDDFDRVVSVDLRGVFLSMKYELRHMLAQGRGTIVNTASIAGIAAEPEISAYVASKHAVIGLTRVAALEAAPQGVRVNALAPGWVETPMTAPWHDNPELIRRLTGNVPMHRAAAPEEIASAVLYLSSNASSYVNGQVHVVDGGGTTTGLFPLDL